MLPEIPFTLRQFVHGGHRVLLSVLDHIQQAEIGVCTTPLVEMEARRMPMFQLRAVLDAIVVNEEEKKVIIDLVENDLKATGYHPNQITAFLQDLLNEKQPAAPSNMQVTRRLRSPFSRSFEAQVPSQAAPAPATNLPPAPSPGALPGFSVSPGATPFPPAGSTPVRKGGVGLPAIGPGQRKSNTQVVAPEVPKPKVPVATGPAEGTSMGTAKPGDGVFFGSGAGVNVQAKPKVLLADDDKRIRIVFKMCLERIGCQVIEAKDGNEAWKEIQDGTYSMVVLDMKMPGLHGLEVLTRMTTKQIHIPVIVCSAYDNLKEEFVVATHPALRYLVKPVAAEALESTARELLGLPVE